MDKSLLKRKFKEKAFVAALIIWPLIHFAVFWIYINFDTIISTFYRYYPHTGEKEFAWFYNYTRVFNKMILGEDPAMRRAFFNSFMAIGINVVILPIAIFSAYAFYKKMPGTALYRVMFYIPQLISIVVLTMAFRYMFDAEFGPVAKLAASLTGKETFDFLSTSSDYLWPVIWLYCIWSGLGSNVILMCGAMLKIPKEVTESAILDGCGFFREMWSIAIPMTMSTIGVFILMTSMSAASFTMPPMLIAKSGGIDGEFMTIGWTIFANTSNSGNTGTLITTATTGVLFTLITTPFILLVKYITKKITPEL